MMMNCFQVFAFNFVVRRYDTGYHHTAREVWERTIRVGRTPVRISAGAYTRPLFRST
jgi:hypothetical protein